MTIQLDIIRAVRSWLKAAVSPALADAKVIPADDKGPRPALPYITVRILTSELMVGEDERHDVLVEDDPFIVFAGERRATIEIGGYGSETASWLQAAVLALDDPEVFEVLNDDGFTARPISALRNLSALLDTKIEARWSQDFEVDYWASRSRAAAAAEEIGVVVELPPEASTPPYPSLTLNTSYDVS